MHPRPISNRYKRHRFPAEIISHGVWLYFRWERYMQRFTSPGHAQRFLSAYGPVASHFRPRRHLLPAPVYRQDMRHRFQVWQEITGTPLAA